jgi:putative ABC transport system permease protein
MFSPALLTLAQFWGGLAWRDARHNLGRTALTLGGIALGVSAFLAIQLLNNNAVSQFKTTLDDVAGAATLEVVPTVANTLPEATVLPTLRQALGGLWPVQVPFYPVLEGYLLASPKGSAGGEDAADSLQVIRALAVDMTSNAPQARDLNWASNGEPTDQLAIFNQNTVYVGHALAKRYGLAVGDTWPVLVDEAPITLSIAGILGKQGLSGASSGQLVLMDMGSGQALWGQKGQLTSVQVLAQPQDATKVKATLAKLLPPTVAVQAPARRGQQVDELLASYRYNLTALSLVALMVAGFLIYNTLSVAVLRRQAMLGTLRALGATQAQVLWAFLLEGSVMGGVGSALGLALGLGLAYGLSGMVGSTTQLIYGGPPAQGLLLSPWLLAVGWLVGVGVAVVGAVAPAWQAARLAPALVARSQQGSRVGQWPWWLALAGLVLGAVALKVAALPTVNGVPVFGFVASTLAILAVAALVPLLLWQGLGRWVQPLLRQNHWIAALSLQQVVASLARCAVAIAALMVAVAMMVSLTIMITSFRSTVTQWVNQAFKADILVQPLGVTLNRNAGRLANSTVVKLATLPGVEAVNAFLEVPITLALPPLQGKKVATHQAWLGVGSFETLLRYGNLRFTNDAPFEAVLQRLLATPNGVLISEPLANKLHLAVGDTLTLPTLQGQQAMQIMGVYYDYASDQGYVLVSDAWYRANIAPLTHWSSVAVFTQPTASPDGVREAILTTFGHKAGVLARTNTALKAEILRIFDATFTITYAMQAIALLVAVLAVTTTLLALLVEHKRELALLWAQGATSAQLRSLIRGQALWLTTTGYALGTGVGYGLALLLIFVVNKQAFGWTLGLVIPWGLLALEGGLFVGVGLLAAGIPLRQLTQHISPKALAYE